MKLPAKLDEVTPEVLDLVVAARYPGVRVEAAEFSSVTEGTTTRARVHLTYEPSDAAASMPTTMWLKSSFNDKTGLLAEMDLLEMESRFYGVAETVEVRAPRAYGSLSDSEGQSLLLLEDLEAANVTFNSSLTPLTYEAAQSLVDELARFHASLWESPRLTGDLAWTPSTVEGATAAFARTAVVGMVPEVLRGSRSDLVAGPLLDDKVVSELWVHLLDLTAEAPQTLLHGDSHVGNTYLDAQGRGGFLDWQCVRRGHWSADVNYFVTSALSVQDRRRWETTLLRRYLEQLERHGVAAPELDEAWFHYRRQALYGLIIWMTSPADMQPEDVCRTCTQRFAASMLDHDTLGLLALR